MPTFYSDQWASTAFAQHCWERFLSAPRAPHLVSEEAPPDLYSVVLVPEIAFCHETILQQLGFVYNRDVTCGFEFLVFSSRTCEMVCRLFRAFAFRLNVCSCESQIHEQ